MCQFGRPRLHRVRLRSGVVIVLTVAVVVVAAGVTDAFGTGTQLRANVPGSFSDGAAADTFWDSALLDIPGVSVTAIHCHGKVQYELQLGATGPSHENRCYAAMGLYSNGGEDQWGVYMALPGDRAVYRVSYGEQPWRYCIAGLISTAPEAASGSPSSPC
jgi:hypothetical protein